MWGFQRAHVWLILTLTSPKCEPKASTYKYRDMEFKRISTFMRKQDVKAFLLYCLSGKILWHCWTFPRRCHGLLSLCSVASFRRISQISDRFSNLPAIGIMIKQKTVSAIISDTWKTHKQVCVGKLPTEKTETWGNNIIEFVELTLFSDTEWKNVKNERKNGKKLQ